MTNEQKHTGKTKCKLTHFLNCSQDLGSNRRPDGVTNCDICFFVSFKLALEFGYCFLTLLFSLFLVIRDFERFLQRGMVKTCASNKTYPFHQVNLYIRTRYWSHDIITKAKSANNHDKKLTKKEKIKSDVLYLRLPLLEKLDVETMWYLKYEGLWCLSCLPCVRHLVADSS